MEFSNLDKAKTYLVLHEPFFATLLLSMPLLEAKSDAEKAVCPSMAVNGEWIMYNREWVSTLTVDELTGALAHEVMHIALLHPWRRGAREPRLWNIACDLAINNILTACGFTLPKDGCHDKKYADMPSEEVYWLLLKKIQKYGRDNVCPEGMGGIMGNDLQEPEASSASELAASEGMAKIVVGQAVATAKMQGKLPGALQKVIDACMAKPGNWAEELARFMTEPLKDNQSWARQQRRFVADGIYLPAMYSTGLGQVAVIVDTSGSVYDRTPEFIEEVMSICEDCKPKEIHVLQVDTEVVDHSVYEPGDPVECRIKGGGGTDLREGFRYLEQQGVTPAVMVVFTDMETPFPKGNKIPDYPVIWVSTEKHDAPFGDIIYMGPAEA